MNIKERLNNIKTSIPEGVKLVAVSKTKPVEDLQEAYDAGQRVFGENKALEVAHKYEVLPKDIEWHFIGHLQTNKVKYIAPFIHIIESVDSLKVLKEINKQAKKNNRVINILLQFHIAEEDTKFGLSIEEAKEIIGSEGYVSMVNINVVGVMGMATFIDDEAQVKREFKTLKQIFDQLKAEEFKDKEDFNIISMGMSGDYKLAIEEGSTNIRVGSSIFGVRNYAI
ncbi:MAG: YggS family pyridoxal phosphate-dependent enzyme [Hyphomicrobiales bacterium]